VIPLVDLRIQYANLKEEIDEAVSRVLTSGSFILGREVEAFEKEVAAYIGTRYAIGVASGTDALFLSLRALGVGPGCGVIVPTFTFVATVESVVRYGSFPIFVDSDMTGNMDLDKLEEILRKANSVVKVIIPVHLYGRPVDMDRVTELAKEYRLQIVEDCAQAWGATVGDASSNKKVGSFGIGCFSCFPTKVLGAFGDGGIVTTNDASVDKLIRKLRNHSDCGSYKYDDHGLNSRLDELQAAILRVKLRHLDSWISSRGLIAVWYDRMLRGTVVPVGTNCSSWGRHANNYYTILCDKRDVLKEHLLNQGIATSIYYPMSLHLQPVYSYLEYKESDFPVAEELSKSVLSLPMYPELTIEQVSYISDKVKEFYNG
jgi:UDP-2-acetamido-2-deoxy-ribo-hexuluronate aminotransferase